MGAVVALAGSLFPFLPATAATPGALQAGPETTMSQSIAAGAEAAQSEADAAAAALSIVHADDVRGHLTLPSSGLNDAAVSWASSDPAVVATDGVVQRPAHGAGDTQVTLTATADVDGATATRDIDLTVREQPAAAPYEGYAFSYFTGNSISGEKIYFAASRGNNALQWDELNDGQPTLESTEGTLGLRDPFLIRSPEGDRFFLIATDLSIGRNGNWDQAQRQGSKHLEIWESTDLVNWSEQRHVKVSPDTAGNTWAPEAYWDESLQQYVVFWASKLYAEDDPDHTGSAYNRMLYATTRDFVTFSEAKIWQDRGESRIDSTVIKENDTYYRFTKDEGGGGTGCSDIIQEKADSLTAVDLPGDPSWEFMVGCIGRDAGTSAVEGPTVFKANPGDTSGSPFYLFVDEYGGRGYIPLGTDDLENPDWRVAPEYDLPASPRHGTVIPVTQAELDRLTGAPVDDEGRASAAAAALEVANIDDVRGHLTLPDGGLHGATVAWQSATPDVVADDGIVHRPEHGADAVEVELTATVTVGAATATRTFIARVPALPSAEPYEGYLFGYFTGESSQSSEQVHFAASRGNNALAWDELNGGKPVLTSSKGEGGVRDPFLIRSPEGDKFFLIATDLQINGGSGWDAAMRHGSKHLEIWESTDLVNWSEQRHVKVSNDNAGMTWAPEAFYDDSLDAYVVYWASKLYADDDPDHTGTTHPRMMYATTRDFRTFTEPQVWNDPGAGVIDATVAREGDYYYRVTTDEKVIGSCDRDIVMERSTQLTAVDLPDTDPRNWELVSECIRAGVGTNWVEGPTLFKSNPGDVNGDKWYLFVDETAGRKYIPFQTSSLESPDWSMPASFNLPASPRHGTVLPLTAAELERVRDNGLVEPVEADENGLVAHYELDETDGAVAADATGHGYDGAISGDATWADGSLNLGGTNGHVKLPDNMMAGLDAITVSTKVWVDPGQATPYFIWGLGNTDGGGVGNGYLFTTGNNYRTSIATGNWTTEQTVTNGSALARGAWKTLTYTLEDGTATLYLDGAKVGEKTGVTIEPGDIGGGRTTANYIGRSVYSADKYFKGKVRDFRIYNRALSADEVQEIGADPTAITGVELDSLKVPAVIDSATSTVTLPVKPGTDRTALEPAFQVVSTSTVSPEITGPVDLSTEKTFTVTAQDGSTRDWTVTAVEMRSPVLPGLYADPNIARFGDYYYIYATSDGFAGWGGKEFYVWKSKDLADWERSDEPFLTLDGANGNVPWASGNAWAPTIIERDGKYYFYFSGHNPTYNRKTIGVAVADSPEGPFTAQPTAMILNNEAVTSGQAIDPAAFQDPETGKYFLFWGNGGPSNGPVYAELSDDMLSVKPGSIKRISGLTDYREGTFLNYRDGLYHLTYSIDDTGSPNYRVGYATATSVDGPWTYQGVILEKDTTQGILGTGHSSIIQVPGTDEWYIAYHRFGMPGGNGNHRETTIDRLTFAEDGTMNKVVPTLTSVDPLTYDGVQPESLRPPKARGKAAVGGTLAGTPGTWDKDGLTFAYQWLRDGEPVAGATRQTLRLTSADVGHRMSVQVTASRPGAFPGVAVSEATAEVTPRS